jgi:biotin-[acetyl-CoA-carboxylase] ligase BirA-like protein
MEVTFLETTESTSTEALKKLEIGLRDPFAIVSKQQTAGRGRRGKSWQGDEGNLFLSIAFPKSSVHGNDLEMSPIKAASLLATFIEEQTSLNPTIKWPNDILIDGKKVCGILCESSVVGSEIAGVCIGIGLNLNSSPNGVEYQVASLSGLTNSEFDVKDTALKLINKFEKEFPGKCNITQYRNHLPLEKMVLSNSKESGVKIKTALFKGVSDSGDLMFSKLNFENKIETVTSVTQSLGLISQKNSSLPLIIADFGNSSAKIRVTRNLDLLASYSVSYEMNQIDREILEDIKDTVYEELPIGVARWPIYYGSVNKEGVGKLLTSSEELGFFGVEIPKKEFRVRLADYPIDQLGFDRLALMESYLSKFYSRHQKDQNNIGCVISFGTATTIDFISAGGVYRGGVILPGLNLSAKSLNDHTSLLPMVNFENIVDDSVNNLSLGKDTKSSIEGGLVASQLGAIKETILSLERKNEGYKVIRVAVSGGGWHLMKPYFSDSFSDKSLEILETGCSAVGGYEVLFSNSKFSGN